MRAWRIGEAAVPGPSEASFSVPLHPLDDPDAEPWEFISDDDHDVCLDEYGYENAQASDC